MAEPSQPSPAAGGDFYVGYLPRMAPGLARRLRPALAALVALLLGTAALLAAGHRRLPAARFEFGAPVEVEGWLSAGAAPWLEVARPGLRPERPAGPGEPEPDLAARSRYLLVGGGKHGLGPLDAGFWERPVRVRGTLAYRDGQTVLEVETIHTLDAAAPEPARDPPRALGRFSLEGEIVDSKCFFGVMNPGELKSHRACAVRCIAGGIPPVLCVREASGAARYLLLVGPGGRAVNAEVLDRVAEPLRIEGAVVRHGDLLVLESDPATYARLR